MVWPFYAFFFPFSSSFSPAPSGTGRKSIVYSDSIPVVNRPYYLATHASQVGPTRMQYAAYFHVPGGDTWGASSTGSAPYADTQPGWRFLCKIEVSTNLAGEWWLRNLYSFVEQWSGVSGLADRAALFGPGFLAPQAPNASTPPEFEQITQVTFDHFPETLQRQPLIADFKLFVVAPS